MAMMLAAVMALKAYSTTVTVRQPPYDSHMRPIFRVWDFVLVRLSFSVA